MKEYVMSDGKLFTITSIDTIRDGGTKAIECSTIEPFYIDKDHKNFYLSYPPSKEGLITDKLLISYLLSRMESYNEKMEHSLKRNKKLIEDLK